MGLTAVPDRPLASTYDGASGKPVMCLLVKELSARIMLLGLNLNSHRCEMQVRSRQIDCRAGVLPTQSNHQAAQVDGTLELVTFHTWLRARKCSGASLRQGMQSPQQLSST